MLQLVIFSGVLFCVCLLVYFLLRKTFIHHIVNVVLCASLLIYYYSDITNNKSQLIATIITFCCYQITIIILFDKNTTSNRNYERVVINGDVIKNVFAGVYVGGAAGSGKTRAIITKLMRHFGKYQFGGIVYAYKNFELVEYGLPVYGVENCRVFAPNSPTITVKINPLDPSYFRDESEIKEFYQEMASNLRRKKSGSGDDTSNFFEVATIGLLTGVTMVMMKTYPQYCTLPHIVSLCLIAEHEALISFLQNDNRAIVQAKTYITSTDRQLSGVQGTISNFLGSFATPNVFYSLYDPKGNYVNLKSNNKSNPYHLFFVNDITNEGVILPVINSLTYLAMRLLPKGFERGETTHSYLLIDEGSTLNLQGFSRKPATLRSFDIATIFSIQDLSLGIEAAGEPTIRAICANLTYQYYGKVNDDKTAEFYEKVSPFIKKNHRSYTSRTGMFSSLDSSETVSTKEEKKYRASDFRALTTGEFVSFIDRKCTKKRYSYKKGIPRQKVEPIRQITNQEVQDNYDNIIQWAQTFLNNLN